MTQKLKYEKYNNSDNVIIIDLHNRYSVIAITGLNYEKQIYNTTLFVKENTIDDWKLIEKAEHLEFDASYKTINSAILKQVSDFLNEGFFDFYILVLCYVRYALIGLAYRRFRACDDSNTMRREGRYCSRAARRRRSASSGVPVWSSSVTNFEPMMAPEAFAMAEVRVWRLLMPKPIIRGFRKFMASIRRK